MMTNESHYGRSPDPKLFTAHIDSDALPGDDLGDADPWNYAPVPILEAYLNGKTAGAEPQRFRVRMRKAVTGQDHNPPAILNWMPDSNVAGIFWYDNVWWFFADSPQAAIDLWNEEAADYW